MTFMQETENQARRVIALFGGIRPMARKTGVPTSTIQSWGESGVISARGMAQVLAAASEHSIDISPVDLIPERGAA